MFPDIIKDGQEEGLKGWTAALGHYMLRLLRYCCELDMHKAKAFQSPDRPQPITAPTKERAQRTVAIAVRRIVLVERAAQTVPGQKNGEGERPWPPKQKISDFSISDFSSNPHKKGIKMKTISMRAFRRNAQHEAVLCRREDCVK